MVKPSKSDALFTGDEKFSIASERRPVFVDNWFESVKDMLGLSPTSSKVSYLVTQPTLFESRFFRYVRCCLTNLPRQASATS